jgi:hypothetical protein
MTKGRETLKAALYAEGAYCGVCGYDGLGTCAECDRCLSDYVEAVVRGLSAAIRALTARVGD